MKRCISILRGINVSGQKKILMKDLKALYEELNFKNVRTYVQSGNVIFDYDKIKTTILPQQIEEKILEKYGFHVSLIVRTVEEMEHILNNNPFLKKNKDEINRFYVTFLSEAPKQEYVAKTNELNFTPDKFIISGKEVYLLIPVSYGNTKLSNNFFENKLKVTATTRNWKTVNELVRIAKEK